MTLSKIQGGWGEPLKGWKTKSLPGKGGTKKMADYPKEIEVNRLMNVVKTFGWEKVKEEVIGQDVVVTVKKQLLKEEAVSETVTPS